MKELLAWYRRSGADFPWRDEADLYCVWVSEVMLQQTQAERVAECFPRFVERFPTLRSLARVSWREVLPYWRGLGYYERARNLLRASKIIVDRHAGKIPDSYDDLRALPGVGDYTARAILCFGFGERIPAIDTNLRRVIGRLMDSSRVEAKAESIFRLASRSSRALNQAFMDLGRTICKSRSPRCEVCPLRKKCLAHRRGRIAQALPVRRAKNVKGAVDVGVACIHADGKYLIGRRPVSRGGLWEFPGGKREPGEDIRHCLKREIWEEVQVEVSVRPPFHIETYQEGKKRWRLHFCRCRILRGTPKRTEHTALKWCLPEALLRIPFPEANRRAVTRLLKMKRNPPSR